MQPIKFLYLSQADVVATGLSFADAVAIVEGAFREHGEGAVENPPKTGVHPLADAFIHAMPGYLPRKRVAGLKWVSGFSGNPARGLPAITGLIVLNDVDTGFPVAVMDCGYVTALRTAAASGVAAKYLANRDAQAIGLVGAGVQGRYHLLTLAGLLPALRVARVFDGNAAILARFVADMGAALPFAVEAGRSAEDVIRGADVVITATGKLDRPVFEEGWVGEGALVLPVHSAGWAFDMLEAADRLVCDDLGQFRAFLGPPHGFYDRLPEVDAELGEIVVGAKPGRDSAGERIVDFNLGIAIHDVAMASGVLARAQAQGLGRRLALTDGAFPHV